MPDRVLNGSKYSRMDQKICGRQPLKNLKGYGLPKADHIPSNFLKASSTNFIWSILKYFVTNTPLHLLLH